MSNRQWLKDLVSAFTPCGLDGTHRLETLHTIYVFRDAMCVDVARRDGDEVDDDSFMPGMRIVGWLLDVEGERRLVDRWIPGARAVLARSGKIALTSPSFGFVACSQPDEDEEEDLVTAEYTALPPRAAVTGSFTRLFPQSG